MVKGAGRGGALLFPGLPGPSLLLLAETGGGGGARAAKG